MVHRILVVDDEATLRKSVRLVLESQDYEVLEASNADECWEKIQKKPPHLILLDIRMPGMPAEELIGKIKSDSILRKIRIVQLTAVIGAKEKNKTVNGVEATIEKPFNNDNLLDVVKKALSVVIV